MSLRTTINKIHSIELLAGQTVLAGLIVFFIYALTISIAGEHPIGRTLSVLVKDAQVVRWCIVLGLAYGASAAWVLRGATLESTVEDQDEAVNAMARKVVALGYRKEHEDDHAILLKPSSTMNKFLFLGVPKAGQIDILRSKNSVLVQGPMRFVGKIS